ncbi:hypothetical protein AOLI_G00320770 [Acnodon oligacanthus]
MFNKQQEHYECMEEKRKTLMYRYRCSVDDSLSDCLKKMKDEHGEAQALGELLKDELLPPDGSSSSQAGNQDTHQVKLQMKGYDFTLVVMPEDEVPDKLKWTQENVSELCKAAKAVVAVGTKLQEMINWLLKAEESLTAQVREAAETHQEQKRLGGNLQENLREARRAKELSPRYREEAGKLLNEAALLSGVTP